MASSVLPQPAVPQTSVGRPRGKPPPVISSRPSIPVGALAKAVKGALDRFIRFAITLKAALPSCIAEPTLERYLAPKEFHYYQNKSCPQDKTRNTQETPSRILSQ